VVRLRPALIFKKQAASEIRRLFAGPFLPNFLLRRYLIPIVPNIRNLRFQAVHTDDVAEAYRLALLNDVTGPINVAADPVLDSKELAGILDAKRIRVPRRVVRVLADFTWRLHLQPTPAGWVDMALQAPIMDIARARAMGWAPKHTAGQALLDLLEGMKAGAGMDTPPLEPGGAGPLRLGEFLTGVGRR
jgi:UDP-glucose 4-epimerase